MSKKRVSAILAVSAAALVCFVLALFFMPIANSMVHASPVEVEGIDYKITSDTTYAIAPGVTERALKTSTNAVATEAFVMEIDTKDPNVKVVAGYGNRNPGTEAGQQGWCLTPLTKQAQLYEDTHSGERVVGGINASLFNVGTGEPQSMLVMDGTLYKDMVWRPYLAIFEDGYAAIIGKNKDADGNTENPTIENAEKEINKDNQNHGKIKQAIGGWFNLVEDGKVTEAAEANKGSNGGQYPRTAVGVTKDGKVIFFQADGIQAPRSTGYTIKEMAYFMKHLGCQYALELDEGGSATYISRREGESRVVQRNISAGGVEREISSSILVASTAKPSGYFDHAVLTPNDEYYTPGSTIELSALAVDSAGQMVGAMPADVKWQVEPAGAGTFSSEKVELNRATAVFTAAKDFKNSEITIKLVRDKKEDDKEDDENEKTGEVGKTQLGIFEPDDFKFDSPVLNLGFGVTSDLGLKAFKESKEVKMHDGDVEWTATQVLEENEEPDENFDYTKYGEFHGLTFTVTDNWKISGSIKVTAKFKRGEGESEDGGDSDDGEGSKEFSGEVTINVGLKPRIIFDGGDTDKIDYTTIGQKTGNDYTVEPIEHGIISVNYGRGGHETLKVIEKNEEDEKGSLVRFGDSALELDWDFSSCSCSGDSITVTEGACIGLKEDIIIEDSPSAFGVWIYAPEGTPNFWFRGCIKVWDGENWGGDTWLDFTQQYVSGYLGGIEWTGWKYISLNISQYSGKKIMIPAGMCLRFMVTPSGCGRYKQSDPEHQIPINEDYKGWLLIDNYQFEYGSNTQDAVNPVIEDLKVAEHADETKRVDLKDGDVLKSNYLSFYAEFSDTQDKSPYNVGIAENGGQFWLDGVRYGGETQKTLDKGEEETEDSDKKITHIWRASRKFTLYLSNGEHCLELRVKDDFGNEEVRTITFTVDAPDTKLDTLRIEADEKPIIGKDYSWKLYASNPSNLGTADLTLTVTPTFMQGDVTCTPADGFKIGPIKSETEKPAEDEEQPQPETATAEEKGTLDKQNGVYSVRIMQTDGENKTLGTTEGLIATISVNIPAEVSSNSRLTWSAVATLSVKTNEDFKDANDKGMEKDETEENQEDEEPGTAKSGEDVTVHQVLRGFCTKPVSSAVFAELGIRSEDQIVGFGDGAIYVTDEAGKPVQGAKIYLIKTSENAEEGAEAQTENTELGTTDENGKLVYNEANKDKKIFTETQGRHTIYASFEKKEGDQTKDTLLSFYTEIVSYDPIKAPEVKEGEKQQYVYFVIYNSVEDMATQKNISWMAYLANDKGEKLMEKTAKIRYSVHSDMSGEVEAEGESVVMNYSLTNNATIVNNVLLKDLKSDTTYYYQVGDGKNWSPVQSFKTKPEKLNEANFFILGDMQGDIGIVEKMNEAMEKDGVDYTFGIQTGDIVDNPNNYTLWEETLKLISKGIYAESDFVHVIGNHEAEGDLTTAISRKTFGIPVDKEGDFYSYEYGPVYVAVLNYTLDAQRLQEFGQWLVQDSKDTECAWKIVVAHVPAYGTNPAGGTDKIYRSNLENYLVEAGVDFFFTGNDHSYARTEPVVDNGTIDKEKGVVHFIVGTAGEKKYAVDTQGLPFVRADQGFNAIYMSVLATNKGITVNAWNVLSDGRTELYDSYTKGAAECGTSDHQLAYDSDTGMFECTVCGHVYSLKDDKEVIPYYTGLVDDLKTGSSRYLLSGKFLKGPVNVAKDGKTTAYYFGDDFIGLHGVIETGGEKLEFQKGAFVPTDRIANAGLAGEKAYFMIGTDHSMRITGSGATYDFEGQADRPWGSIVDVTSLEIGKDITAIGKFALMNIPNVASFTFEEGSVLERIGYDSLREIGNHTKLERVVLPQSVKTIEAYSFRGCKIGMLVLPDGLEKLHENTFHWSFGIHVNVLEGSTAETLVKKICPDSYSLRHYIAAEKFESVDSGICVVEDVQKTTHTAYYFADGKLMESEADHWTVAKACILRYNALTSEQKAAHPADHEILKEAVDARNAQMSGLNESHFGNAETGVGISGRKDGE